MDSLVLCPCGHSLAAHGGEGCRGDRFQRCGCTHPRLDALEAAIEASRLRTAREPVLPAR